MIQLVVGHADLSIADIYTFEVAEVADASRLSIGKSLILFQRFSLSPGDLQGKKPEYFFLDNPIWQNPMIRIGESLYFCLLPQGFFHNVHRVLGGIFEKPAHLQALEMRRSEFLETQVTELFQKAFPAAEVRRNVKWKDGHTVYETDLLVRVDSFLFIVEAKAGGISDSALRGAPLRIRRHIEDLLISPSIQSQRLADKLNSTVAPDLDRDVFVEPLGEFLEHVRSVIRISVTLEDFATLQAQGQQLAETGWLPSDLRLAPSFSVADLEVVFEILANPAERIHYLSRRNDIARRFRVFGDELDWLGVYLDTGLRLEHAKTDAKHLIISGMSKKLDDYFQARDMGLDPPKPKVRKTKLWREIGEVIEKRISVRWSEIAVMLLNMPYEEQHRMEKKFRSVLRNVRRKPLSTEDRNALIASPTPNSSDAFVMLAMTNANFHRRYEFAKNLAGKIFSESSATRVAVLIQNVDTLDYPYSMLAVLDRNEKA
jgi:hypothetical protein